MNAECTIVVQEPARGRQRRYVRHQYRTLKPESSGARGIEVTTRSSVVVYEIVHPKDLVCFT